MSSGSSSEVGEGIVAGKMSHGSSSNVGEGIVADKMPSLMNLIHERVGKLSHNESEWSIYKVPSRLRELNKDAYNPRIVSIGPIHSGQENLQNMEVHKIRYLESLFLRTIDPDLIYSNVVEAIQRMKERAHSCYYDYPNLVSNSNNSRSLVEILLVDGCFLLELFLRWYFTGIRGDPIFGAGTIHFFRRDLTLLENQIPFFVLERMYDIILLGIQNHPLSLTQLCASFYNIDWNLKQSNHGCKHLLDLIRNCYVPRPHSVYWEEPPDTWTERKPKQNYEFMHCVTKLRESGIKFVEGSSENLFDIKFTNGALEIPKLRIDHNMDSLLRNMIAFEQCDRWTSYHITSYAILMDYLIDSPADVEFLQHKRIIENCLGHDEEVSNIFNNISNKVFVEDFYFDTLCNQVNEYSYKWWPRRRARLRRESFVREHFFSPWKFIGLVAAFILLAFAGLQTGYTMASYLHPPKLSFIPCVMSCNIIKWNKSLCGCNVLTILKIK